MIYIILLLLLVFCIFVCLTLYSSNRELLKRAEHQESINQEITQKNREAETTLAVKRNNISSLDRQIQSLEEKLSDKIATQNADIDNLETQHKTAVTLLKNRQDLEINTLKSDFDIMSQDVENSFKSKLQDAKTEYDAVREIVDAATASLRKQQATQDGNTFYLLDIKDADKVDFKKISLWKEQLNNPRIISMLLWQTYIQKPLKILTTRVLNTNSVVTGIYKITCVLTGECYIGQSTDIAKRWQEHCKCGCGIDAPAANKLYNAMQKYGIWNFSFELLSACPRAELNEKEKEYIKIFDSVNSGYNTLKGNSK